MRLVLGESSSPDWIVFGKGYDKVQAFKRQIENFCHAIRKEEPLLITAEDAIGSVETIEAAYRSLAGNHWVQVSGPNEALSHGRNGPARKAPPARKLALKK